MKAIGLEKERCNDPKTFVRELEPGALVSINGRVYHDPGNVNKALETFKERNVERVETNYELYTTKLGEELFSVHVIIDDGKNKESVTYIIDHDLVKSCIFTAIDHK